MDIPTKLIIGLGNPGKEYERTRHNVGFAVLDEFARRNAISLTKREHQALVGEGRLGETRVYLMKPLTYMNLSGQSVASFLRLKPLELTEVIVVTDDIALPLGKLRLRAEGSAGGHNGLKSLIQHLHSQSFPRLRFGVGAPRDASVQIDFVLGQFNRREQVEVEEAIDRAVAALETWADKGGLEQAMQKFN
jgi:PTH1 family peptidyl-tRNA hydrolase